MPDRDPSSPQINAAHQGDDEWEDGALGGSNRWEFIGTSRSRWYELVREGELVVARNGNRLVSSVKSSKAYLARNRV